jgi:hypothetical protein
VIVQHSSKTNEHYTPIHVVDRARSLLGGIDLDPASCAEANMRISATRIYTEKEDGLRQPWSGRVFLNPPGGKMHLIDGHWQQMPRDANGKQNGPGTSSMVVWWDNLVRQWANDPLSSAVFVGFTLEILRSSQADWVASPVQRFPRCYPSQRLKFGGTSPTHANIIVYLPPYYDWDRGRRADNLQKHFGDIGYCEGGS